MNSDVAAREVAREQEYVDTVYAQLEKATASAQELAKEGLARGRIGNEGGLVERDAMVFQAARRMATLDAAHEGLVFGRLDMRARGQRRSRATSAASGCATTTTTCMLIDWRAPAAAVFYQATQADPLGVVRRRILRSKGVHVLGVEDDLSTPRARRRRRCRSSVRARCWPSSPGHATGRCTRSWPPSRPSRTARSARRTRAWSRSAVAPAPARRWWRCTVRRTCSTPTAGATRPVACSWSVRPVSSCATSSGCCPRWVRPPSRCARSARWSTAFARAVATSRRWRR